MINSLPANGTSLALLDPLLDAVVVEVVVAGRSDD
jgi:hypothetical protein